MDKTIRTPIIILNWNGLSDTQECMTSLFHLDPKRYEVILVDNGSADNEREEISRLYGQSELITIILNAINKGFTRGNDDIVQEILKREKLPSFIALLNNDTVIHPDWIDCLIMFAEKHSADIVSSKMINYFDRRIIDNLGHFMLNTGEILPLGHREPKDKFDNTFENLGACGGAALYRVSMIQEIGFFDNYFDTGYEDAEFGLRAKVLGYKCMFCPEAIVFHKVSQSIKKLEMTSISNKFRETYSLHI